jgi:putative spermidine/putrescine transport system permease protein
MNAAVLRKIGLPYLLSLPGLLLLIFCFALPIWNVFLVSVTDTGGHTLSLKFYKEFLTDGYSLGLLWVTFKLSLITTVISLVLAFPVALYMRQVSPMARSILAFLLLSPLLTSVIVRTLAWVFVLGPHGVLNDALAGLGFMPVKLLYNETGIVIGLVHVFFGYMVLSLMTSMMKLDGNLLLAARNLGASQWKILYHIVIPLCLPDIVAGSVLVFTMSSSTYATPALLGGTGTQLMAPEIYDLAVTQLAWDEGATVATILFVMSAAVVAIGTAIAASGRRKIVFG